MHTTPLPCHAPRMPRATVHLISQRARDAFPGHARVAVISRNLAMRGYRLVATRCGVLIVRGART